MLQLMAIGVGAGVATAVLFASVASGALLSILLFSLAPLPVMIVTLGWSPLAGLIGAVTAAAGVALSLGPPFLVSALLMVGPAWWLCRLALLARPATPSAASVLAGPAPSTDLEWYPPGRLVLWSALLTGAVVAGPMLFSVLTGDSFDAALRSKFELLLRMRANIPTGAPLEIPGISNPALLIDLMVMVMPPLTAMLTTGTHVLNLWLAGRIVAVSGRLRRPWPDLPTLTLPKQAPLFLAGAVALSFLTGMLGTISLVFAAGLLMAFAIVGHAVLQTITQGRNSRYFILPSAYGALLIFPVTAFPMALLGLADIAIDIRGRFLRARGSPPAAST